jgi:hypothetical protein
MKACQNAPPRMAGMNGSPSEAEVPSLLVYKSPAWKGGVLYSRFRPGPAVRLPAISTGDLDVRYWGRCDITGVLLVVLSDTRKGEAWAREPAQGELVKVALTLGDFPGCSRAKILKR